MSADQWVDLVQEVREQARKTAPTAPTAILDKREDKGLPKNHSQDVRPFCT
jgi:hypothetical protein